MFATKLSGAFVAPSRVANILDWRRSSGAVMCLDITRENIGIAVAEHPEHVRDSVPLASLSLRRDREGGTGPYGNKHRVAKAPLSELEAAVRRHRVCAFVVNWPVHEGRAGERCGKVLQVLDSVVDQSNGVVTRWRPFTLWCSEENTSREPCTIDEWGRSADFAKAPVCSEGMSYSSKSAARRVSSEDAPLVAAGVLDGWVRNHWDVNEIAPKTAPRGFFFHARLVDGYTNKSASLQAALL